MPRGSRSSCQPGQMYTVNLSTFACTAGSTEHALSTYHQRRLQVVCVDDDGGGEEEEEEVGGDREKIALPGEGVRGHNCMTKVNMS